MYRKMLGVVTAVAAALMLVGVAWAAGDAARDDSGTISVADTAATSPSTPTTDDTTGATAPDTTSGTAPDDNSSSTSTSIGSSTTDVTVDDSTTSTTIDDNDGTTGTTIDDNGGDDDRDDDEVETRSPAPVNSEAKRYVVGDGGSVAVQIVNGRLVLLDVKVNEGWTHEVEKARTDEIEVKFESGNSEAEFEAKLRDGQIRIEIERDDD